MTCPLCGAVIDYNPERCAGCLSMGSCVYGRCPHCGYQIPDVRASTAATVLERLLEVLGWKRNTTKC